MSTTANIESVEKAKESVGNGKSCIGAEFMSVKDREHECCVKETVPREAAKAEKTESLFDWFVMLCVLKCNLLNGINHGSYSVLYIPMTDMFQASRASVGWISSFHFALGSFLGEFQTHLAWLCTRLCLSTQYLRG